MRELFENVAPTRRSFLQTTGAAAVSAVAFGAGVRPAAADPSNYPAFSWATTPCCVDIGKLTDDYSPSEIAFLANHFAFVAVQKGRADGRGTAVSEAGIATAAAALKAANPRVKVLGYWSLQALHPEYALSSTFNQSWAKTKSAGQVIFNLSDPSFRSWWIENANKVADIPNVDGLFIDSLNNYQANPDKQEMLAGIHNHILPNGKASFVIANGFPSNPNNPGSFLDVLDGLFYEHFDSYESTAPDKIKLDLLNLQQVTRAGKVLHFRGWPGFTLSQPIVHTASYAELVAMARKNITFPLACFLAIAERNSYFQYSWGYDNLGGAYVLKDDKLTVDPAWYPELLKPLGAPKGEATVNGYVFAREFAHAKVRADVSAHTASIEWS